MTLKKLLSPIKTATIHGQIVRKLYFYFFIHIFFIDLRKDNVKKSRVLTF